MTNPFPFVAGATLTAAELNAIGETETWTPNFLTGVTVGNGTLSGHYQQINDLVFVQGSFELGSTSAVTSDVRVDVPIAAQSLYDLSNGTVVQFIDTSLGNYWRGSGRGYGSTQLRLRALIRDGSNYVYARQIGTAVPFTWGTTDRIEWSSVYRVGS